MVRETIDRYTLPGIAVGVIDNGKVVFARGYGEAVIRKYYEPHT